MIGRVYILQDLWACKGVQSLAKGNGMPLNRLKQKNDVIRFMFLKNWRALHFRSDGWMPVAKLGPGHNGFALVRP